ncbi:hypothetical protein ACLKMH_14000 [Psychromonas sp. KJ10-10]|uniref:hypothetical protein n=1 Tax=Psychromonas sp. KJ10-10 TaxID=3391823 RepID=UPI0039B6BC8E
MKKFILLLFIFFSQVTLAYNYSGQGTNLTLSCLSLTNSAVEGFSFNYEYNLSIDSFMGSPLIKSHLKWGHNSLNKDVCITPYGSKESTKVRPSFKALNKIYPYQATLILTVKSSSFSNNAEYFIAVDPGVLSSIEEEFSFNTPRVKEWEQLIFSLSVTQTIHDTNLLENVEYLSKDQAKEFFIHDLTITAVELVNIKYNLNAVKQEYVQVEKEKEWKKLAYEAEDFVGWFTSEFKPQSERLLKDIFSAFEMDFDSSFEELTTILTDIAEQNLPDSFNATAEQKREFKQYQSKISMTLEEVDENISFNYLFSDFTKDSADDSNRNIYNLMSAKREELSAVNNIDRPKILKKNTVVNLDCFDRSEELLLKKGTSLINGEYVGELVNQGDNGYEDQSYQGDGVTDAVFINNTIVYICRKNWAVAELKVVDLNSNIILDEKFNNQIKIYNYFTNDFFSPAKNRNYAKVFLTGDYLVRVQALSIRKVTIDIYNAKDDFKKETVEFAEEPMLIGDVHANFNQIIIHLHQYSQRSELKIIDIESMNIKTISDNQLNYETEQLDHYDIIDVHNNEVLIHHYYFENFVHSLIIKGDEVTKVTKEKLNKLPSQ